MKTELSMRERQVLAGLAHGRPSREIALRMGLSVKTISTYKHRVQQKLRLASHTEVAVYARMNADRIHREFQDYIQSLGGNPSATSNDGNGNEGANMRVENEGEQQQSEEQKPADAPGDAQQPAG